MEGLHKYVPSSVSTSSVVVNGAEHMLENEVLYPICFGGDQMSVARYRGSAVIRNNSTSASKRLEGLFPVNEDWHSQVTLLKVYTVLSVTIMNFFVVNMGKIT